MSLLLQIGAGLLAAALLVLALPMELRFQMRGIEPLQGQVAVRMLFGLWQKQLATSTPRPGSRAARTQAGDAAATLSAGRRPGGPGPLQAPWSDPRMRRKVLRRLRIALKTVRWSALHLHLRVGLDDPADTGRLWAVLGPLGAGLANMRTADIVIQPDFAGPTLDFDTRGRLVFVPLRLLWSLAVLASIVGLAIARQQRRRLLGLA